MRAAVYEAPKTLTLRDIPIPVPGPGEALLRTRAVGICGSDVHGYLGETGRRVPPLVMGHEVVAEVAPTPAGEVSGLSPGALVAVNPLITCGECAACRSGDDHVCARRRGIGMFTVPGAMSEYFTAPAANLVPLPAGVAPAVGALAEPLAVGMHAWAVLGRDARRARADASMRIAVIGAGMIGAAILAAIPEETRGTVVACDVRGDRLERVARLFPWAIPVDTARQPWADVRSRHAPDGFDAVFEVVGRSATVIGAVELAGRGATVVWVGLWEPQVPVPMQAVVANEVAIVGSYAFTSREFRDSVARLPARPWLDGIVDAVLPLEAAAGAFAELAAGSTQALKLTLDPTLAAGSSPGT